MDSSKLADRLRGILKVPPARSETLSAKGPQSSLASALGGGWCDHGNGRSFIVERRFDPDDRCGRLLVGDLASRHRLSEVHAPLLATSRSGSPAGELNLVSLQDAIRAPFVFLDLETTGLSGGAGTHAFLVGLGGFDEGGGFVTRQHLLVEYAGERALLEIVARELSNGGAIVSFNGKSFDAPVLETRYLFHRLEWPGARMPHLDAIYAARRFWGGDESTNCSLTTLEHKVLGARRVDDVSGFEIPGRYFQFVRSGDARPLAAVFEHNRRDLLSLAGLTARLLELVTDGPAIARDGQEALALGRVYERASLDGRARESFQLALLMDDSAAVRLASLRHLAIGSRRARRFEEAAIYWQTVLDLPGCPPNVRREAIEALAIHHEHRVRDLGRAKSFALKSLELDARPAWSVAVRHRLARLERKMERADEPRLLAY
jgi:uncharacterized protein